MKIELPESRQFYSFQIAMEAVHSEMYSLLIDSYIQDQTEKKHLFNAIDTIPAVKRKADWGLKWITFDKPLVQRLLAFVCVEGIFFSGSFCAIYWLKNKGLMPGLATANEFISRDENLHTEYAIELYNMVSKKERLEESVVHALFREAVEIEKEFITESLPVALLGMNSTLMIAYIEFVADRWISMLGYSKFFNSENPFGFMDMISLSTKENFFETRTSQYQRAGVGQLESDRTITFDEDEDF
jgi:ribonucleoside-diphosphate reductase beta chain